jgi:ketosteroid isomerase-like protein
MKSSSRRRIDVALLLLAGLAACHRGSPPPDKAAIEAETQAIQAAARDWFKAIEAKDLDKTLSFYAPDAEYLSAGRPAVSTAEGRRKFWIEDYASPGFASEETTTRIEVAASGDLAYQSGTYIGSGQDARGTPTKSTGKFVVVWKKQPNGQWKAIIDIDNADQ